MALWTYRRHVVLMGRVPVGSELRIRSGRERSSRKHHSLGDWECPPGANERRQAGGFISKGGARPTFLTSAFLRDALAAFSGTDAIGLGNAFQTTTEQYPTLWNAVVPPEADR